MRELGAAAVSLAVLVMSQAAPPLTKVDVSLGDVSINKVPQLVAADQGIYAKYGLDVHQTISAGAARAAAASGVVVPEGYVGDAGAAPIQVGGGSPMIYGAVVNGRASRVIVLTQEPMVMDHVIAQPGIAAISDLKGKRLGFSGVGAVTHFSALALARRLGWSPERDITLVGGAATVDALKQKKVDAILGSAMVIALARQAGFRDIGDLSQYRIPVAGSGIMVDKSYLASNRDTVLRFLKADIEATALMQRDRKVFDAALAKWFNITDPDTQAGMFAYVSKFERKPYPSVDGIKQIFVMYDSPEMRRHTPGEFYDSSLVAELDKSGFLEQAK
ncbi:MAG TPA: ABC transporter substrate-binding protein [Vicinamibacterales bacterium]|jgi:NitT/TauT family transport system substrate-binding protein|nr:ABC transporter substrate-binding protein [Vicinamibacterales bacterium]